MQLGLKSGGGGLLCTYALQCGSVQRINDYGFVFVCLFSMHCRFSKFSVCAASGSFLSARTVLGVVEGITTPLLFVS